jgi:hypothetical protein
MLEQEISPPNFPIQLQTNIYYGADLTYDSVQKGDKRNREGKFVVDINDMNLSRLQRQRLIFLLGPRYKNSSKFKIVYRKYETFEKNLEKAFEILKLLYIEAKRAPILHPTKCSPKERANYFKKYLGKTKEEREIKKKKLDELYDNDLNNYNLLKKNKEENFTLEKIRERMIDKLNKMNNENLEKSQNEGLNRNNESSRKLVTLKKDEVQEEFNQRKKLTPKAFKLFVQNKE